MKSLYIGEEASVLFIIMFAFVVFCALFLIYMALTVPRRCTICGKVIKRKKVLIIESEVKVGNDQIIIGLFCQTCLGIIAPSQ